MFNSSCIRFIVSYFLVLMIFLVAFSSIKTMGGNGNSGNGNAEFTEISSPQAFCPGGSLVTDDATGSNPFFILDPGHQITLEGVENKEDIKVVITVLDETEVVDEITTRVVEEHESADGEVTEISRNFFVRCDTNNNIFYMGEDVDDYEDGEIVGHDGEWRSGIDGAEAGIFMPGTILLGSRFFQEMAPEVALDRAEIVNTDQSLSTPLSEFINEVLVIKETTPIEPFALDFKYYAPGIGLIKDDFLELTVVN